MAENTKIEWCDHTFNPWMGCTKVSQGCANCYAETLMDKRYGKVKWGPQGLRVRTSAANWKKPLKWNREAAADGRRARVFCASLADVFEIREGHKQCDELQFWRHDLFDLIDATPNLDWLLLTKRPQNVMPALNWYTGVDLDGMTASYWLKLHKNVWIGASVENQKQADKRIPALLGIPARVRFLSMEPLLGPVDIEPYLQYPPFHEHYKMTFSDEWTGIDWVIVGGESGPNARPMYPAWARAIMGQCQDAGVPFFFKQWGDAKPNFFEVDQWEYWGRDFGKKKGGRLLAAREWNEFPHVGWG